MMNKEQFYARYYTLCHAIQSGVASMMHHRPQPTEPKHLRTGLNVRAVDHGALVALLIEKSVFTEEEYAAKLVEYAEREVANYEKELSAIMGTKVTLA